jgi:hypothetical protein
MYAQTTQIQVLVNIKLHAPTSSTQKLKLMGRGGQFTYIPTVKVNLGAYFFLNKMSPNSS